MMEETKPNEELKTAAEVQPAENAVTQNNESTALAEEPATGSIVESPVAVVAEEPVAGNIDEAPVAVDTVTETELVPEADDAPEGETIEEEQLSFLHLNKEQILEKTLAVLQEEDVTKASPTIKALKEAFRYTVKEDREQVRMKFLEAGGEKEEFEYQSPVIDSTISEAFKRFDQKRAEIRAAKEKELKRNTEIKESIVNEIKELVDKLESGNQEITHLKPLFDIVHQLQDKWRTTGLAISSESNRLYSSYRFSLDRFYKIVQLNKELRELDSRRNLEAKLELCEKAELLLNETSVQKAVDGIRALQSRWKETGFVMGEQGEQVWQRFKSASDRVYDQQKEWFEGVKQVQQENIAKKTVLLQHLRELLEKLPDSHQAWQQASQQLDEIFNHWKSVGFAPKLENEKLWEQFKEGKDVFYKAKEKYYDEWKKQLAENLRIKNDICQQAEALKESTDWKKTADLLKKLQEQWKKTGAVPQKQSDKIWKRFRSACDAFFENKKSFFAEKDSSNEENLKSKEELIARVEAWTAPADGNIAYEELRKLQEEWINIGHVPMKEKDRINSTWKKALDKHFDSLRSISAQKNKQFFEGKYNSLISAPDGKNKANYEIQQLQEKIKRKEAEAAQLENNMGFFANSKNAQSIIKETEKKVEVIRAEIRKMKEQIKIARDIIAQQNSDKSGETPAAS
jgi:hypothetical protein